MLEWLLGECSSRTFQPQWADLRMLPTPPRSLAERVRTAVEIYPCDLLFIHRDAEREPREVRVREIQQQIGTLGAPAICIVPVRMQEAWLLFDEKALRRAAGNPNGRTSLALPEIEEVEQIPDPKELIHGMLRQASELPSRRLRRFNSAAAIHRLAELIDDFSPLRALPAFQALESDVRTLLAERAWS
jgi:hypothetical protein